MIAMIVKKSIIYCSAPLELLKSKRRKESLQHHNQVICHYGTKLISGVIYISLLVQRRQMKKENKLKPYLIKLKITLSKRECDSLEKVFLFLKISDNNNPNNSLKLMKMKLLILFQKILIYLLVPYDYPLKYHQK